VSDPDVAAGWSPDVAEVQVPASSATLWWCLAVLQCNVPAMGIWKTIKAAFAPGTSMPPDARRLSAVDELALSASLRALPVGERGWITLSEARALFSPMEDRYAFGEMDEVGKTSLAAFAAESDHRSAFDLMPVEGRVYFTRRAP